jgi:hypothetical protein
VKEHRRFERYAIALEVELSFPGTGKMILNTKDMSDGGVFLHMSGKTMPPLGMELVLKLTGMVGGEEPPRVRVRVVRVTEEGIGLEFLDR